MGADPAAVADVPPTRQMEQVSFAPPSGIPTVDTTAPPPQAEPAPAPALSRWAWRARRRRRPNADLIPARPPYRGAHTLRVLMSCGLGLLAVLTFGGGLVLLLLWRQDRTSGVLSNQVDRAWDLVDALRQLEVLVAVGVVPLAMAWAALTTLNVRRATARRRNPVLAALSIPVAVAGVWAAGAAIVEPAGDWPAATGGLILQAVALAIPVLTLERVAFATEGPRRPLRATYVAAVALVAHIQGLGALSTIEATDDPDLWGRLSAYLIMASLIEVFGAIAANEACRSIDGACEHRYAMRKAFGESVLLQVQR